MHKLRETIFKYYHFYAFKITFIITSRQNPLIRDAELLIRIAKNDQFMLEFKCFNQDTKKI